MAQKQKVVVEGTVLDSEPSPKAEEPEVKVTKQQPKVAETDTEGNKVKLAANMIKTDYSKLKWEPLYEEIKVRGLKKEAKGLFDSPKGKAELRKILRADDKAHGGLPDHLTKKPEKQFLGILRNWKVWAIVGAVILALVILFLGVTYPKPKVANVDLTSYAKKSDIPNDYLTEEDLTGYLKEENLSGYATKTDLEGLTETEKVSEVAMEPEVGNPSYNIFDPISNWDWDKLAEQEIPTFEEFLEDHGLTDADTQDVEPTVSSWELAIYVVELDEDLYGKQVIPLKEGYIYTAALSDGTVQTFWGGDPEITEVQLQWGFTARWVQPYLDLPYVWLDPADPTEFVVRENRFGRYRRNPDSGLPGIPYFDRFGPYQTLPGNVLDWDPPSLDAVAPRDYRDAAAMLGGLAKEDEWSTDGTNWTWKYSGKVPGSGDYCQEGQPCWQTTYIPPQSTGFIELWNGEIGAPSKFYSTQLSELLSGRFNVDEFSYHPYGD